MLKTYHINDTENMNFIELASWTCPDKIRLLASEMNPALDLIIIKYDNGIYSLALKYSLALYVGKNRRRK